MALRRSSRIRKGTYRTIAHEDDNVNPSSSSQKKSKRPLSDAPKIEDGRISKKKRPSRKAAVDSKEGVNKKNGKAHNKGSMKARENTSPTSNSVEQAPEDGLVTATEDLDAVQHPWGSIEDPCKLKAVTWNVASCRSMIKNGALIRYIDREAPDVLCLQETKMTEKAVQAFPEVPDYDVHWNHSEKKGYSGVAILVRKDLKERKKIHVKKVDAGMGLLEADREGRVLICHLSNGTAIVNAYVPNSGQKLARLEFRTKVFEAALRKMLNDLAKGHHVVYCGDLNVAHEEIDIHDSKGNRKHAGHTPEEREEFSNLLSSGKGWVDSFRELYPSLPGYTYFSRRFGPRLKNEGKGWRLDYHVVDKSSFDEGVVGDVYVRTQVEGSDHYPVVLEYRIG